MSPHRAALRPAFALSLASIALLLLSAGSCSGECESPCGEACCESGTLCNAETSTCEACTPSCDGRRCGDDGCGGSCGECTGDAVCNEQGICAIPTGADAGTLPPTPDAGRVGPAVTFKVMNWNVRNYFDDKDDPAKNDTVLTASALSSKVSKLAAVINKQTPDVLTLQEVETKDLLGRLNTALTTKLPHYELLPGRDPRGINVAIMSRFPLSKVVSHKDERLFTPDGRGPYYWSRDCLQAHLDVGGNREVALLVNHLISQVEDTTDNSFKRQAQAQRTREIADAIRKAAPWVSVLITGDMNDDPTSASTSIFFGGGAYVDFWAGQATSAAWTYKEGTKYYRLDYLLPDKATAAWKTDAQLLHGTDIGAASDHSPVVATFVYP